MDYLSRNARALVWRGRKQAEPFAFKKTGEIRRRLPVARCYSVWATLDFGELTRTPRERKGSGPCYLGTRFRRFDGQLRSKPFRVRLRGKTAVRRD